MCPDVDVGTIVVVNEWSEERISLGESDSLILGRGGLVLLGTSGPVSTTYVCCFNNDTRRVACSRHNS